MAVLDSISGAEPSTVTFKLRTVQLTQNSSAMQQEILTIGDPDSTNALAAVLATTPASTAWALVTRAVVRDSTVFQGAAPWSVSVTTPMSSVAASSGSSAILTREVIDAILTTGSTDAFGVGTTAFSVQSSGADLRSYVTAYSILTTNAGPTKVAFFTSGTMLWPLVLAAVSSAVTGANLAVSAPAYLFRTAASEALTLRTKGSSIAGWHAGVSYFRAP